MSFLFFDNLAIVSRMTLLLLQAITSSDNAPVLNRVYSYLRVSFISMCVCYVFDILPIILSLYLCVSYNSITI